MSSAASSVPRPDLGPPPEPPKGFRIGGVAAGIKSDPKLPDVAVFASDRPCTAAGVFTRNRVTAAPVQLSRGRVPSETTRAVVVNSGNANACTGAQGLHDARRMAGLTAEHVGCKEPAVLVCSTGIIGTALPMDRIERGIALAVKRLNTCSAALESAARALMTTDTVPKWSERLVASPQGDVRVVGLAKGAAMIAPQLATMLAVVLTDAPIAAHRADALLRRAVDRSFNCISVDGHTSTNDTVLLLASGAAPVSAEAVDEAALGRALEEVCIDLAKAIVADAEGGSHRVTIAVEGARDMQQAKQVARAIADSPLVKTAVYGADPNWGRILSAAGYAGVEFNPDDAVLWLQETLIYEKGTPVRFDAGALSDAMRRAFDVSIRLELAQGAAQACFWTSDLTEEYIRLNAQYHT
jgi:glutamate N-acetyltransferase/amino-acid N-acetyltransferase